MLNWFMILTPLLVLGVVALLGFVGCDQVLGINTTKPEITLDKLNPNVGATAGGTMVTLTGGNFADVNKVTFGGVSAYFQQTSDSEIDAISPTHPVSQVDVIALTPNNSTNPLPFTYVAIGFVQFEANSAPAGTSIQVTLPNPTTAGNILIATISYLAAGPISVKDDSGNAFSSVGRHAWFQGQAEMFYLASIAGGAVTVTASGGSAPWNICVSEYTGGVSLGAVSGNNSPSTGAVPENISGVAVTPATGNSVYVVAFAVEGSNANLVAGSGFSGHSVAADAAVLAEDIMSAVSGTETVATASPASFLPWVVLAAEIHA
jgi:hypothetical protein